MARSVYIPSRAAEVAYADASWMEDSYEFDDAVDCAIDALRAKYPSLEKPSGSRWIGNEGRVILENKLVSIVVSEYCGLVAISAVVEAGYGALAERFGNNIDLAPAAACFGDELVYRARFSNGEALFDRKAAPNKGELGLGYSSKEGWI
jgi:hypothetical protein